MQAKAKVISMPGQDDQFSSPIPHKPDSEAGALGCILLASEVAPERLPELFQEFQPQLLHDLRHRIIYKVLVGIHTSGGLPNVTTVRERLDEMGQLDAVGGLSYVAGLPSRTPSVLHFETFLGDLREVSKRRALQSIASRVLDMAVDMSGKLDVDGVLVDLQEIVTGLNGRDDLEATLLNRRFNQTVKPQPLRAIYTLANAPVCTPGNLSTITAGVKNGKSAAIGAMIAGAMLPDGWKADTLGFVSRNERGLALVHIDTEQSPDDYWHLLDRARRRAKLEAVPGWLHSYYLTGLPPKECWALTKRIIDHAAQQCGGIHSILIDGVADLVNDVNDPGECNPLVAELHGLAIKYDTPILGVIHFNPGTAKSRGHLGSQLERKAETNLMLEKEGETTVIWSEKQRRAPILKATGPRFRWSDEAGMHVSCESLGEQKVSAKVEQYRLEVEDAFADKPAMRYGELVATVKNGLTVSQRTAERRVADYVTHKLVKKSFANLWEKSF